MPLEDPDTIDLMAKSPEGKPLLVITDAGLSPSPEERLAKLIAKLETYVWFVMSADFTTQFPGSRPGDVTIEVVCAVPPTEAMTRIESLTPGGDPANRIAIRYRTSPSRLG